MHKCQLSDSIQQALDEYFKDLNGEPPHAVYDMVLGCVEKPMIAYVLQKAGGNQSKAATILGLNRNTLRKKMQQYQLE